MANCIPNDELMHYGVRGMKWGIRRFQNPDGSLTKAGIRRYGDKSPYEVVTSDGDTFHVSKGSKNNYNTRHSKVTKTWGQHNKEVDDAKAKKRISKQYAKEQAKGDEDLKKSYNRMYVDAYNKAADKMNGGGIDRYNRAQEKKYGKDYVKRSGYENDYMKMFNKEVSKNLSKSMYEFTKSNSHYKKATEFVKKYDMLSWDELAKSNSEGINAIRKQFEKK
jgi:hypothetical protein